jgi:predicted esterase
MLCAGPMSRCMWILVFALGCEGTLQMTGDPDAGLSPGEDGGSVAPGEDAGMAMPGEDAGTVEPGEDAGTVELDAGTDAGPMIDAGPPFVPDDRVSSARHTARPLGSIGAPQGFWEYLPPNYGDGNDHPLLVFLHGIGENGNGTTELSRVVNNGLPRLIRDDAWPNSRPFIVVSPQHPGSGCPSGAEVHAFMTWAIEHYDVDTRRVYLTGLSCGAIGTWNYLAAHLDSQIAALVPIAGDGRSAWNSRGCALGSTPIWGFHGDADNVVVEAGTITPLTNLMSCDPPADDIRMTIYPDVGHDSWTRTYNLSAGHDIYAWMLSHTHD